MTKSLAALLSCTLAYGIVHAEPTTEFRVLGPAWSHHFGTQAAVVDKSSSMECDDYGDDGQGRTIRSSRPIPGLINAPGSKPGAYIYYRMAAPENCKTVAVEEKRNFQEVNPSFGLELTRRYDGHSDKVLVTFTRDSYDTPTILLAAGRMWPLATLGSVTFDGGVIGGLWYRSVLNRDGDGLDRRLVPIVLPAMSLTEKTTGLGLNLGLAPRLSIGGRQLNATTTLMVQTTLQVAESSKGSTRIGLGFSEQGGFKTTLNHSF